LPEERIIEIYRVSQKNKISSSYDIEPQFSLQDLVGEKITQ